MNNKILAIALSIIAVIVVIYQIFLREDDDTTPKNKQNQFVKNVAPQNTQPVIDENSDTFDNNDNNDLTNNMIIDLYSPQLLKKVKPYIKNKNKELMNSYGTNIFGYKKKNIEKTDKEEIEQKIPILKLDGIVELIKDKISIAIINNRLYKKGEIIKNAIILKIEKDKVLLKFNNETIILTVDHGTYKGWIKKNGGNL